MLYLKESGIRSSFWCFWYKFPLAWKLPHVFQLNPMISIGLLHQNSWHEIYSEVTWNSFPNLTFSIRYDHVIFEVVCSAAVHHCDPSFLQIPEEEKNLGPHDCLVHVYHFNEVATQDRPVRFFWYLCYPLSDIFSLHPREGGGKK